MRESFDKQLNQLNILLMNMAALVEQIIAMSVKSLEEQNTELAGQTVEFDTKINDAEREIERLCLKLLLQYQPVFADDLRRVSTALKMITDMERIGDQAADIAQLNITLIAQKKNWELGEISQMARESRLYGIAEHRRLCKSRRRACLCRYSFRRRDRRLVFTDKKQGYRADSGR